MYNFVSSVYFANIFFVFCFQKLNAVLGSLHPLSDVVAVLNHRRIGLGNYRNSDISQIRS